MLFTSNHDENSWNKADYATMPGAVHAPFAVFTQTMGRSVPLVYSGQEEPVLDSLSFFYKDTIHFNKFERAGFYKTLLELRKNTPALASNASFRKVEAGNPNSVYAYLRENGNSRVLVLLNLSAKEEEIQLKDPALQKQALQVFTGKKELLGSGVKKLGPWGYEVYVY
jgi:glycosidase